VESTVETALNLLRQAQRPVILAGNGVRLGHGLDDFHRLIERLQIPVLLTWKAIDFLAEDYPLYCGRPGGTGQRGANFTQQNADFLLIIGARLDAGQTAYNHANFARAATRVMVDIDPAEIDKMQTKIHLRAPFDAGIFLKEMTLRLDRENPGPGQWSSWLTRAKKWHGRYPLCLPEFWQRADFVDNYVFIEVLGDLMTGDDLLVPGSSGQCSEITMQAFKVKAGQRILNSEGLGPMGFGIAAPLGACLASDGKRTVSIDGDGGFIMNVQELETLRRLNLPVKIFVLNNNGYGSIRSSQRNYFQGRYVASDAGSGLTIPNLQKVVESYGVAYSRLENHSQIREQVAACLAGEGPAVCEIMISPDQATQPRVTSKQLANGSFASNPMEDMSPPLSREEFKAQMLIPPVE
jgi:acetolactate synthase-1/2/3 large subunit